MTFNPAGDQLFTGEQDLVQVFDLQTGGEVSRIPHRDAVVGLSVSPDGTTLVTASSKVLQFWDIPSIPLISQNQLVDTACMRVIQNFDQAQWTAFFGKDDPFRILCGNVQE
jgi:WD40 repeat protein